MILATNMAGFPILAAVNLQNDFEPPGLIWQVKLTLICMVRESHATRILGTVCTYAITLHVCRGYEPASH